jgi:hypothetical protein
MIEGQDKSFAVPEQAMMPIYPNPTNGKIFVNIEKLNNETVTVNVFNLQGAMVHSEVMISKGTRIDPDLTGLNQGLYFLKITGKDFSVSGKVTIN